ncbi:ATP-binding protein [Nocardioides pacificus]
MEREGADVLGDAGIVSEWVLAACPDALWLVDLDSRTLYANEQMAELLGAAPAAMAELRLEDVLDRLPLPRLARRPVLDDEGRTRAWLHRVALPATNPVLDPAPIDGVGVFDWDIASDRLSWSDGLHRITGVRADGFVATSEGFLARLPREDRAPARAALESVLIGTGTVSVDVRILPDEGDLRWLRLMLQAERDAQGAPVRVRGIVQDVTESKEAENTLTFLSWMGRAANDARTLQDVLAVAERKLRPYAKWWPVLISIPAGPDDDELIHLDLDLTPVSDAERAAARRLAEQVARERRIGTAVGPQGTVLAAGAVTVGERLACVLVDETGVTGEPRPVDLLVFEQVLGMLARVAEREWAALDLAQARDEALRASLAKTEFLATMSHEIRTPLNGVIGLTELLANSPLTEHQRRLTRGLDLAGRALLGLVDDVLDLSKIEAGHLELERTSLDPRGTVEASVSLVAERARAKGLEIAVITAPDLPARLLGDPFRLAQVITNLTTNAVKFTAQGQIVVHARVDPTLPGPGVRVEVRDSGIGISRDSQAKLFRPFSQADTSTTREYGGTGLGLAISQRIVSAMGGEIGVWSEPGAGSTFWFTAAFEPLDPAVPPPPPEVEGQRILVVHHNPTARAILVGQLNDARALATGVGASAAEISAALRLDAPYDVVLLDHRPPEVDALALARLVRDAAGHDGARLIAMCATRPEDAALQTARIERVLSKPVLPSLLLEAVAGTGGPRPSEDPTPAVPPAAATPAKPRGRILVVEDNPVNQLVAGGLLAQLGYAVVMTDNGAEGLAALTREPDGFDAVLMDCQMPVLDGYDATRAIRGLHAGRDRIPIIAMTAGVVERERDQCLAAGMDDFVPKPVILETLEATLARWVPGGVPLDATATRATAPHAFAGAAGPPEFDRSRLDLLLDGGEEAQGLVLRILDRFNASAAETMEGLREAAGRVNADDVRQLSHRLRGSAANIGLVQVAALCESVESEAAQGRLPSPDALLVVELALARGVRSLASYASELTGSG